MANEKGVKKVQVIILSIVLILCCVLFNLLVYLDISKTSISKELDIIKNNNIEWEIENISVEDTVRIQGWAIILDEEINSAEYHIILRNTKNNEFIKIPTQVIVRPDLNERFANKVNHDYGGFYANIKTSKLNLENNDYEIIINYKNNNDDFYVETEKYVE